MANLNKQEVDKQINFFFSLSRELLGDQYLELLEKLDIDRHITPSQLPLKSLFSLLNAMNVTLDSIISGTVDTDALVGQFSNEDVLPKKYTLRAPYSSRFAGFYMLDYIEKNFGERSADLTRQHLQLKKRQFEDLSQRNNILLSIDITKYVLDFHGEDDVFKMGMNSMVHYRNGNHGKILSGMKCMQTMIETFFHEFAPLSVEQNYDWKVKRQNEHSVLVTGHPKDEVMDLFGQKLVNTDSMEILRQGFFTALPSLISGYVGRCRQLKSLSGGDAFDVYEISFTKEKGKVLKFQLQ